MKKNIVVILGHPDSSSYCGALAKEYVQAAEKAGHEVQYYRLGETSFDPTLRHGYRKIQELEPDLIQIQEAIVWSDHLVFFYPIWWGAMPSLLKGFFDRAFLPGYAFKYRKNSPFWDRLLAGRSAHVITTMDTPPWYFKWFYKMPGHHQIKNNILEFSGIKPVKITSFGSVRYASPKQRGQWLTRVKHFAQTA